MSFKALQVTVQERDLDMHTEPRRSDPSWLSPLPEWIGETVVVDLAGPFLCIGRLAAVDMGFLTMTDADFHDLRDSNATRESYVIDSRRVGVRRNRSKVLIKLSEVVAVTKFEDVD
jgi:hypothetical protein